MKEIDLNTCVAGQKLVSCHGLVLEYVGKTVSKKYPHKVKYPDGSFGTRSDDGQVFIENKLATDHDIAEILEKE